MPTIADKKVSQKLWLKIWLALWPTLPGIAPLLMFLSVRHWRSAPLILQLSFGFYCVMEILAATFSPNPELAIPLAILRSIWIASMLGLGLALATPTALGRVGIGLSIIYATSIGTVLLSGRTLIGRLDHPFFMPTALGFAGAVGVWLALFVLKRSTLWRCCLGASGLAILLLTGSRTAFIAFLVGTILALLRRPIWAVIGSVAVGAALLVLQAPALQQTSLARLTSWTSVGRSVVWHDALSIIQSHVFFGVGPYLAGKELLPPNGTCDWFTSLTFMGLDCPPILDRLGNPWVIAHNLIFHELLENGLIGLIGYVTFLAALGFMLWKSRHPFLRAIAIAALAANVTDNVTLVPSPFFAEFFLICSGIAASEYAEAVHKTKTAEVKNQHQILAEPIGLILTGGIILLVVGLPLWISAAAPLPTHVPSIVTLLSPSELRGKEPYLTYLVLESSTSEPYRLAESICDPICRIVHVQSIDLKAGISNPLWIRLPENVSPKSSHFDIQIDILKSQETLSELRPLISYSWSVK